VTGTGEVSADVSGAWGGDADVVFDDYEQQDAAEYERLKKLEGGTR
jgi:hypothetical protein